MPNVKAKKCWLYVSKESAASRTSNWSMPSSSTPSPTPEESKSNWRFRRKWLKGSKSKKALSWSSLNNSTNAKTAKRNSRPILGAPWSSSANKPNIRKVSCILNKLSSNIMPMSAVSKSKRRKTELIFSLRIANMPRHSWNSSSPWLPTNLNNPSNCCLRTSRTALRATNSVTRLLCLKFARMIWLSSVTSLESNSGPPQIY